MPSFTITVSQEAVNRLQQQVARTNENTGSNLTLKQWIVLHLREVAIADDLAAAVQTLQQQHQKDAETALADAIRTARDQLMADLDK